MRRMAVTFISSMQSLLGASMAAPPRGPVPLEAIRQAMLDLLHEEGCQTFPHVERRILLAADLQALWYLRSDLMAALSYLQGERIARQNLQHITDMFEGALPKGMFARPVPHRH
jgi:hypothetical protein